MEVHVCSWPSVFIVYDPFLGLYGYILSEHYGCSSVLRISWRLAPLLVPHKVTPAA